MENPVCSDTILNCWKRTDARGIELPFVVPFSHDDHRRPQQAEYRVLLFATAVPLEEFEMIEQGEGVHDDVIVGLEDIPSVRAVRGDPLQRHDSFVGEVFVRIDKVLLDDVLVDLVFVLDGLHQVRIDAFADHEDEPQFGKERARRPRLANDHAPLVVRRAGMNVDDHEDARVTLIANGMAGIEYVGEVVRVDDVIARCVGVHVRV